MHDNLIGPNPQTTTEESNGTKNNSEANSLENTVGPAVGSGENSTGWNQGSTAYTTVDGITNENFSKNSNLQ